MLVPVSNPSMSTVGASGVVVKNSSSTDNDVVVVVVVAVDDDVVPDVVESTSGGKSGGKVTPGTNGGRVKDPLRPKMGCTGRSGT